MKVVENLKKYHINKTRLFLQYIFLKDINDNECDIDRLYEIVKR